MVLHDLDEERAETVSVIGGGFAIDDGRQRSGPFLMEKLSRDAKNVRRG